MQHLKLFILLSLVLLNAQPRAYLAISKSIPLNTLKQYAYDIEGNTSISMVLNGFIDNNITSIKPTMNFMQDLLKQGDKQLNIQISINSKIFSHYNIQRVPCLTVDYAPHTDLEKPQEAPQSSPTRFYKKCGDFSLEYLFSLINKEAQNEF